MARGTVVAATEREEGFAGAHSGVGKQTSAYHKLPQEGAALHVASSKRPPLNRYILAAALLASTSSALLGYDVGVTSGALLFIQDEFGLNNFQKEVFVSSLSLVSLLGALISGRLSDAIGRRRTIACASLAFLGGALGMALAPSYAVLLGGRLVTGVGVGFGFTVAPLYTAELAPPAHRGMLVALAEVFINVGILLGYLASFALKGLPQGTNWRWMLALGALPAAVLGLGVFALPESPRWLVMRGRSAEALAVLEKTSSSAGEPARRLAEIMEAAGLGAGRQSASPLGGEWERARPYEESPGEALGSSLVERGALPWGAAGYQPVTGAVPAEPLPGSSPRGRGEGKGEGLQTVCGDGVWRELLRPTPAVKRMLLVCIATNFFQQATGIDAAVYYSPVMFEQAGIHGRGALLAATLAVGVAKASFTVVAMLLLDRFGRRPLLLLSTSGMTIALLVQSLGFLLLRQRGRLSGDSAARLAGGGALAPALTIGAACLFVAAFSLGLGPICWVLTVEIFPLRLRAQAFALGTAVNRLASGTVTLTFLTLGAALSPSGCFLLFAAVGASSIVFFYKYAPETKGKTLEEITGFFERNEDGTQGLLAADQELRPTFTSRADVAEEAVCGGSQGEQAAHGLDKASATEEVRQERHVFSRLKATAKRGDSPALWG